MKLSKYSFVIKRGPDYVLYNCWTEKMGVLEERLKEWLESSDVNHIQKIHPEFYNYLLREKFIVDNEVNEVEEVIKEWKKEENSDSFGLMINSTLDCNMQCWYCYEKHKKGSDLTIETSAALLKLVKKKIQEPQFRKIHISFFGGEPLLNFNTVIWPFLVKVDKMCQEQKKLFSTSMTSNSYLLSNDIIEKFLSLHTNKPVLIQVTIDGNEEMHNKTRYLYGGGKSYQIILSNIKQALNKGIKITLRFNCTNNNIRTFVDVLSDLSDLTEQEKSNMTIDLQRVWQDPFRSDVDMNYEQLKLRKLFIQKGFIVNPLRHINPSRCYADNDNHVVVNYNGDLYKCSARDFTSENREGVLTSDGKMEWNEKRALREKLKYSNKTCLSCRIYPLCHGGCSQGKMDRERETGCLKRYTDIDKIKIIQDRVEFLLEQFV